MPTSRRNTRVDTIVVGALVLLGAALRAPALGQSSFWFDDAWVAVTARADSFDDLVTTAFTTPLFNHGIGLVVRVLGERVVFGQAVPFVVGSVFAGVGYLVLVRLGLHRGAALAGATLAVVAPAPVMYATRVKPYTLEALATGALLVLAIALADGRGRPAGYTAVAAVGILVSGTVGITAIAALAVVVVLRGWADRGDRELWPWFGGLVGLSLGYWLVYLRAATPDSLRDFWRGSFIRTGSPSEFLSSLGERLEVVASSLVPEGDALWPLLLVAAVVALWHRPRWTLIVLAPAAATIAASSLELVPLGGGRTDIHLLPVAVLLVAIAVDAAVRWSSTAPPGIAGVATAGLIVVVGLVAYESPDYPAQDLRPLVAEVEAVVGPDGVIIVYPSARYAYGVYTDAAVDLIDDDANPNGFTVDIADPSIVVLPPSVDDPAAHGPRVADAVAGRAEVWYIGTFFQGDEDVIADAIVARGFVEVHRIETPGARAIRYQRVS